MRRKSYRLRQRPPLPADRNMRERKRYTAIFESWGEYLDHVTTPNPSPSPSSRVSNRDYSWDLNLGWDGTVKCAREGWPEGTAKVNALSATLTEQIASTIERYDPYYSLEGGGQLDVARYLEGEPECWIRYQEITSEGPGIKLITLSYNSTASAVISAETLLSKGSVIVALVECLEYAGHRVKVQLVSAVDERQFEGPVQSIVKLKDFNETLDIDRLAFALGHPASFRRLNFSWAEHLPREWMREGNYRYGLPIDVTNEWKGDIYIPYSLAMDKQWNSPSMAKEWILGILKEQGVTLQEEKNNG